MKAVLFESVGRVGKRGDIVEVSAGYFRNYLQPRKLAAEATAANLALLEHKRRKEEKVAIKEQEDAAVAAGRLEEVTLRFTLKVGEGDRPFGSVTAADITAKLCDLGYDVDKKRVQLEEPIRKLGLYTVHVRLHSDVTAKVKLLVEKA
jgi:large subunit ribosomal protein L9